MVAGETPLGRPSPTVLRWLSAQHKRIADPPDFSRVLELTWTPDVRLALLLCLPAAVIAAGLRLWLLYYMPGAFVHGDTGQILLTPETLLERDVLLIHSKKTFLTPILYSIPAVLHLPIVYFAAIVQHVFGVLLVFVVGLLAKAWLSSWRLWLIPLTVLIAIDPVLLWYEHTALPESLTVFGVVLVALAGTFFYRLPNRYTLSLFFLSLLFVAGARPEGRYFCLLAIILIIRRFWGDWPRLRLYGGLSTAWAFFIFVITRTGQSGILLYASMIHWSPDHLLLSPGLAERMQPFPIIAAELWEHGMVEHVKLRKAMVPELRAFLVEQGVPKKALSKAVNDAAKRAGVEIAVRNFWRIPGYAVEKFFIAHRELPAQDFTDFPHAGQVGILFGDDAKESAKNSLMLWGVPLSTPEEAMAFMRAHYDVSPGATLTPFLESFVQAGLYPIVPMQLPGTPLRGIPWLYAFAFLGAICLILRERPAFGFQLIWFIFLCALFCAVIATGNVRARFRVIFEPFWFIYLFALLDSVLAPRVVAAIDNVFSPTPRNFLAGTAARSQHSSANERNDKWERRPKRRA